MSFVFPISEQILLRFVSYLYYQGFACASIQSTLSAISYVHKAQKLVDPCLNISIKNAMLGIKNLSPTQKESLPIHLDTLIDLVIMSDKVIKAPFTNSLFKAMTTLAYFALLRVGEFTFSKHVLGFSNIQLSKANITINFQSYKHSKGKPYVHTIKERQPLSICPVHALNAYMSIRPQGHTALFVKGDGMVPSRKEYWDWLKMVMLNCGLNADLYSPHSLRIGMATQMALSGASSEQIKIAGRWSSDAFRKYIRVTKF